MSEKKARQDRKIEVMAEEEDHKAVAEDMAKSVRKMIEDRDEKAHNAKAHLVSQLRVTVEKYRTANGVMSALQVVRDVCGTEHAFLTEEIDEAKSAATMMAKVAKSMADKAEALEVEGIGSLCDGFYDAEFSEGDGDASDMVIQLLRLQLCQNVGPSAEDISDFVTSADAEIDKARDELRSYCEKNGVDYLALCGE